MEYFQRETIYRKYGKCTCQDHLDSTYKIYKGAASVAGMTSRIWPCALVTVHLDAETFSAAAVDLSTAIATFVVRSRQQVQQVQQVLRGLQHMTVFNLGTV